MRNIQKICASFMILAACGLAGSEALAQTRNDRILLKIDNVSAQKGDEFNPDMCNFEVMVYNRTANDVSGANIEMQWMDNTITGVMEKEREAQNKGQKIAPTTDSDRLNFSLDIPAVRAYKQVNLKASVRSDKCFLLMNKAFVKVNSCDGAGSNETASTGRSNSGNLASSRCAAFELVTSKDPQYYKEFKQISVEEQKAQEKTKFEKDKEELNTEFDKSISLLDNARSVLRTVR